MKTQELYEVFVGRRDHKIKAYYLGRKAIRKKPKDVFLSYLENVTMVSKEKYVEPVFYLGEAEEENGKIRMKKYFIRSLNKGELEVLSPLVKKILENQ